MVQYHKLWGKSRLVSLTDVKPPRRISGLLILLCMYYVYCIPLSYVIRRSPCELSVFAFRAVYARPKCRFRHHVFLLWGFESSSSVVRRFLCFSLGGVVVSLQARNHIDTTTATVAIQVRRRGKVHFPRSIHLDFKSETRVEPWYHARETCSYGTRGDRPRLPHWTATWRLRPSMGPKATWYQGLYCYLLAWVTPCLM